MGVIHANLWVGTVCGDRGEDEQTEMIFPQILKSPPSVGIVLYSLILASLAGDVCM